MTRNRGTDLPLPGATCGSTDDELGEHSAVRICEESLRPLSCMSANTSEPISTSIMVRSSNDAMAFVSRCVLNQHGAQVAACDDINRLDKHSLGAVLWVAEDGLREIRSILSIRRVPCVAQLTSQLRHYRGLTSIS